MRGIITLLLDLELRVTSSFSSDSRRKLVGHRLRAFPYWRTGHKFCVGQDLLSKNITSAYGAAQAVAVLSYSEIEKSEAGHLLARVLLAGGEAERALNVLNKLPKGFVDKPEVQEDISACLMALGKDEEAQSVLLRLCSARLSPEGRAVMAYLEKKLSNKLYS